MKTYTIKKRRDGQGWQLLGELYAKGWQDAKRVFTERCINEHDIRFVDASSEKWFFKSGYYLFDETGSMYPEYIASGFFDTFRDDVYVYTIRKV